MRERVDIPTLPGYVSVKEAAVLLGLSDKRVYQYVIEGRLPAKRASNLLLLPIEEVQRFKPGPSGRMRARAPSWRSYRSRGKLLATEMHVQVRAGQQEQLAKKLQVVQEADSHTLPGTVARYVIKEDAGLDAVHILLIWKDTEMPDEATRSRDLEAFQAELADVLDWDTARSQTNDIMLHT